MIRRSSMGPPSKLSLCHCLWATSLSPEVLFILPSSRCDSKPPGPRSFKVYCCCCWCRRRTMIIWGVGLFVHYQIDPESAFGEQWTSSSDPSTKKFVLLSYRSFVWSDGMFTYYTFWAFQGVL